MVWLLRFFIHAARLRSFSRARWVMDYEWAERGFHTARFATEKEASPLPADCDLDGEFLKGESKNELTARASAMSLSDRGLLK